MPLFERSEFGIFSGSGNKIQELAVASCSTARRAFLLTFFAGKKVRGMVKKTGKEYTPESPRQKKE
jgi:hypothetical protein